tara:strand:+ start:54 stop:455 length:402 start_codon:yes stop_codon:yes gene_type:complete
MAFKMNGAPFQKHKPGHKKSKTGHIPPYEKGDDLRERFLAKRAAKAEKKFDDYLDESGSVESPKGDRLAIKANKAADAHQKYTDKRTAKNEKKKNKGKNKEVAQGATREDRRKENKQERKQNRADRKANRKNK